MSRGVRRAEGDEPSTDRSGTTLGPKRIALFRRVVDVSRRPLHPLLVFEWSRLDLFGRRRPIAWRRSAYAFMLFLGVSGFAMGFSRGATAAIPGFWMDVSEMFMPMLVTQFIVGDLYRGAGLWWLGFPYSRGTLLFFRGIAGLTANFAYSVLGFLCIAVGLALHYLLFRLDLHALAVGWSYVWHVTLACLLLNPIVTALGFATSALTRGWRAALAVLIYMVGYSGIHFYMMGFVFSTDILSGPRPVYWSALGMTLLVGIPLAWVCFRAGVRNVHNFITMKMWGQTARQ